MESEFGPKDIISMMPGDVVTNILHRLPIQDAVRTGILSRNWRYKWTMLSEVVFDWRFAKLIERRGGISYGMITRRLLLHFNGAITKFKLDLTLLNVDDILHLILFLSNKGIKDLTLTCWQPKPQVKLPTHLFSCLELKNLKLFRCCFNPLPSFRGFPNLLSLKLIAVEFGGSGLGELITQCPLLEILKLDCISYTSKVKLVEIAKLENLKILFLPLCNLETTSCCNVFELMGYLPKLQELELDFHECEFIEGVVIQRVSAAFSCLKALKLSRINLNGGMQLLCAFELIRSCPKLQTLETTTTRISHADPSPQVDYNTTRLLQLQTVMFGYKYASENELCLIKYLLASSPSLKKIVIYPLMLISITSDEKLKFAMKLLKLHRASPDVNIDLSIMEVIHIAPKLIAPGDFISTMPDNVITNILDRLPLQYAVRTSIMASNWRFKWTMLSQLVFDDNFFKYLTNTECNKNNYQRTISRLLLHIKSAITKFDLSMDNQFYSALDVGDIDHWIMFLSRNGIKNLTIWKTSGPPLMLPTHFFSCLDLKHLKLRLCSFVPPASFHGFPNLLSLELSFTKIESGKLEEFFTRCPMLEILNMNVPYSGSQMKLVTFSKLANLKILSLFMCNLDNSKFISSGSIFELVSFLPKLQELDLDFILCRITDCGAKRRFPITFPSLKTLKLTNIDLEDGLNFSCAFEMIRSFPNLQTLEISAIDWEDAESTPKFCSLEIDCDTKALLQLQSVVFTYSSTSENEVCLIKYLLASSPFLRKIVIRPRVSLKSNLQFKFSRKLVRLHRASLVVEIDLS